jgi:peptide/nickel transport system substrate-binding protein
MIAKGRCAVALAVSLPLAAAFACRGEPRAGPPPTAGAQPAPGRPFVVATQADVTTFNECQSAGETTEMDVIALMFPSLANEQPDYSLHPPSFAPRLAASWEFSPDRRTLTFHLRPGARWSDGAPITANDVRFTFKAQKSPAVGSTNMEIKDFIRDVEVVDPTTARFHFTRVYPYQLMDANDGHILPEHAWGKVPFAKWPTADFAPILVTGGPFRLAAHTAQQTIILERDPGWWGAPRPYVGRLVFRILPEAASQLAQLLAGDVDLVQQVSPAEADRIAASPELRLVEFPSRLLGFVGWNNRRAPFTDRRVRRALTLGINRKAIVDTAYRGHARLANGPVLSSMWAYDRALPNLAYDPKLAQELLEQAGWRRSGGKGTLHRNAKDFAFDLLYPAGNTIREQVALLIQADLARIGVEVHPVQAEFTSLVARTESGDFDAVMWVWEEATKVDLTGEWSTRSETTGSNNYFGYSNPEVDTLIATAREEPDYTKAKPILDRIQDLIVADQPVTFLYEADQLVGVTRRLEGANINAAGVFFNVEDWRWGS